jgi:hypothetical protein
MFLRDLEPYRYSVPAPLDNVVAVGWLSQSSGYPTGDVSAQFIDSLAGLMSSHRVNPMRGYHACEFCSTSPLKCEVQPGKTIVLGSAEIWVPSANRSVIYAAPDLVYHYVKEHHYLPPGGFIDAVMAVRNGKEWDANEECQRRLDAAFRS